MEHAATYTPPQLKDYGTLLELTAAIDVNFVGMATNAVMAAISNPIGSPRATDPTLQSGSGGVLGGGGGGGSGGASGGGGGGAGGIRPPFLRRRGGEVPLSRLPRAPAA